VRPLKMVELIDGLPGAGVWVSRSECNATWICQHWHMSCC
jgi:hypothetical protein